jgi:TCP-1/cpn60 chaperonin family
MQSFAEALEVIPTTLAKNAGLNPIKIVTELRHRHEMGEKTAGVSRTVVLGLPSAGHCNSRYRFKDFVVG